jgi:CRP/FNR family transcriptional regulator
MNHNLPDHLHKCSTCVMGQFCLPVGINADDMIKVDSLVQDRIRVKKGTQIYQQGEKLNALYSVRFGTLKTENVLADGRSQVTGFHLAGEIVGLDGMGDNIHPSNATALEDSEVCMIKLDELENLSRQVPSLQSQFHRILSREISQDHRHLLALGTMRAEERLANFLLNLSDRLALRGYSANEFNLKMSREDIGSYLGVQLETVSRLLSRFAETGLIQIKQRHVKLIDLASLEKLAGKSSNQSTIGGVSLKVS